MMLSLWIVTSSFVIASFGADVDFSIEKSCYSEDDNMKMTAVYTGSGTVTAVQWYYSGQSASNLLVLASTCVVGGVVPPGFPDISRMTFTCDSTTKTYTLTLSNVQDDEIEKSWGATFSLSSAVSPDVKENKLTICLICLLENFAIFCAVLGGLGIIILIVLIVAIWKRWLNNTVYYAIVIVITIILLIISIILAALVVGGENDDCSGLVGNCGIAFVLISPLGLLGNIIPVLLLVGAIGPGRNANKGKIPAERQEMT